MEIKYEVEKLIGVLSEKNSGWKKELNIVSWNGLAGKFDIREWSPDHDKMGKGVTLSEDELLVLFELLKDYFNYNDGTQNTDSNVQIQDMLIKK